MRTTASHRTRRLLVAGLVALWGLLAAQPAAAADACPDVTATAEPFFQAGPAEGVWLENMGFDGHGGMWVSELMADRLVRFDAQASPGRSLALAAPGASLPGPDGRMYAIFGDSTTALAPGGLNRAGVVAYDPQAATPQATPFADGLPMANGAAFDAAGNLYVADTVTSGAGLIKLRPDGTRDAAFTAAVPISGADGIAIIGDTLYVTLFSDPAGSIVRVPLAAPATYSTLVQLSPAGAPAGPDDLTVGPDGRLWVATNGGQVVRVDPATGAACAAFTRAVPIDSVRFPRGFAPFDELHDAFLTSEQGEITHLRLTGVRAAPTLPAPAPAPAPGPARPAVARPRLRLTVTPRHVRAGRHVRLHAVVRSASAACRAGARVRLGKLVARTDARGRATLRVGPAAPGVRTVRATKRGCVAALARVRVR